MDFEGIAVDSYSKPEAPFDITTIGIEFSVVLKSIQRAAQMLEANPALTPEVIREGLTATASPIEGVMREMQGAGVLQPLRAVEWALANAEKQRAAGEVGAVESRTS